MVSGAGETNALMVQFPRGRGSSETKYLDYTSYVFLNHSIG